jgi:hypothetical protein
MGGQRSTSSPDERQGAGEGRNSDPSGPPGSARGPGLDARLDQAVPTENAAAFLLVLAGGEPGRVYPLARNTTVVGRAETAPVRLAHPSVSLEHARIINGSLGFEIEDLGSTNGVLLNGEPVTRARLASGDQVTLGNVVFTFMLDRAREATVALLPPGARPMASLLETRLVGPVRRPLPPQGLPRAAETAPPGLTDFIRKWVTVYRFLRPYASLIFILGLLGASAGVASGILLPPPPVAICEAKLVAVKKSNPVEGGWRPPAEDTVQFFAEADRAFASTALVRASLKKVESQEPDEGHLLAVKNRLSLELVGERLYRATYKEPLLGRGQPPPVAFLEAHMDNYLHTEIERALRVFNDEAEFLRSKLAAAQTDLSRINGDLAAFKRENADHLPETAVQANTSRFTLESRRGELTAQIARLEGELAVVERQVTEESPLAQTRYQSSQVYRDTLATLNRRLSEAYARGLADGHPDVQQIRNEKARVEKLVDQEMRTATTQLDRSANPGYAGLRSRMDMDRAQLKAARQELRDLDRSLGQIRNMVGNMPAAAARLDDLQRAHESIKRLHDQLFDQVQKANLQIDIERLAARSRYEIVTPVALHEATAARSLGLRGAMGLVVLLMFAALIIGVREGRRVVARTIAVLDGRA